jgi:tetratricopeptide (TPR) repeat protein
MNPESDFLKHRIQIDEAITYNDLARARVLIGRALEAASLAENVGERLYFGAQALILRQDFAGAIRLLDKVIAINPKDGAAYNDRALCMVDLGQWDDAQYYFDRGIAVEPDFATIHHNKGWFLNQLGRCAQALVCFEEALRLSPGRAVTYENMADAYFKLGRLQEAIGAYDRAISFLPDDNAEIKAELLRLVEILRRQEKGDGHR